MPRDELGGTRTTIFRSLPFAHLPNRNFELAELDFVLILDLDQRIASILKIWIALRKNERVPEHPSPEPKALVELA